MNKFDRFLDRIEDSTIIALTLSAPIAAAVVYGVWVAVTLYAKLAGL